MERTGSAGQEAQGCDDGCLTRQDIQRASKLARSDGTQAAKLLVYSPRVLARLVLVALALVAAPACAGPACAQAEPVCDDAPDDRAVRARLSEVRAAIAAHEPDMRHWWSAFLIVHGVLGGVQLTLFVSAPEDGPRADFGMQALSSFLGMATLLISTPPLLGAGGTLDAMPEDDEDDRLVKLASAEGLLRRSADAVSFVRGPLSSLLTTGYGEAASLVLLLAFGRPSASILLAAGSALLGQGRLLLHPWGIRDAWRDYRRRYPDAGCDWSARPPPALAWSFTPFGAGLGFQLRF